ncbi:hypothetical protein [Yoonia sp. 208BN28-4]|uniref:hypothetical protein n=1 Tax=Yoonia sp. 208BN28-4 TaxID=3126505 RepID=UPI0030A2A2C8
MFTIEHAFDATIITLVDEPPAPLAKDVTLRISASDVTVIQHDPDTETTAQITLSHAQVRDIGAALNLPEGVYLSTPSKP